MSAALTQFARDLAVDSKTLIREYVAEALAPLAAEVAALKGSPPTTAAGTSPGATKETLERKLARAVAEALRIALAPVKAQLSTLSADLETLKASPPGTIKSVGVSWEGTFESGRAYIAGMLITHKGGLWLAEHHYPGVPGEGLSGWKLVVKSGGAAR